MDATQATCARDRILRAPEGVLASVTTLETGCGGQQAPWQIELRPGQRIELTLYDFQASGSTPHARSHEGSVELGDRSTGADDHGGCLQLFF